MDENPLAILLERLDRQTNEEPDRNGERWIDCPNCGAEATRKKCSYGPRGWHCFLCGEGGSLGDLTRLLDTPRLDGPFVPRPRRKRPETNRPFPWQQNAAALLGEFEAAPNLVERWNEYRPFSLETIRKWHLGLGVLPSCRCHHERLIYPAYNAAGQIIAFRGRSIECDCAKWIQSAGSRITLWGGSLVRYQQRQIVLVCESPIDAMLAMQEQVGIVGVATTGGAGNWQEGWTTYLSSQELGRAVVWYDNDLPGTPCEGRLYELIEEWKAKHPKAVRLPDANGPKVANALLAAGVPTRLYRWPIGAPLGADLSWALMNGFVG